MVSLVTFASKHPPIVWTRIWVVLMMDIWSLLLLPPVLCKCNAFWYVKISFLMDCICGSTLVCVYVCDGEGGGHDLHTLYAGHTSCHTSGTPPLFPDWCRGARYRDRMPALRHLAFIDFLFGSGDYLVLGRSEAYP